VNQQVDKIDRDNEEFSIQNFIIQNFILIGFVALCLLISSYTFLFRLDTIVGLLSLVINFIQSHFSALSKMLKLFGHLAFATAKTLWIPILIYISLNLLIKDKRLKGLSYIATICLMYLVLVDYVGLTPIRLNADVFADLAKKVVKGDFSSIKEVVTFNTSSLIVFFNLYFFTSLVIPTQVAKIAICIIVSWIVSLFLVLIPDLPIPFLGGAVDWSINRSLDFFFFVLYFLAALTQMLTGILEKKINLSIPKLQASVNESTQETSSES
jgi:hypothetical protein